MKLFFIFHLLSAHLQHKSDTQMPAEADVKWKNALILFYSISFGFVYPCIYATLFPKDCLEVELFEQRLGIPAGQGRRLAAAVPPGGLAPQPWGPAAGSEHQGGRWAPDSHCKGSCFGSATGQRLAASKPPGRRMYGQESAAVCPSLLYGALPFRFEIKPWVVEGMPAAIFPYY